MNFKSLWRILLVCLMVTGFITGCMSAKYSKKSYDPNGNLLSDTQIRYDRLMNQKIEGLDLRSAIFDLGVEEQEANHDEAIGKAVEGLVDGLK